MSNYLQYKSHFVPTRKTLRFTFQFLVLLSIVFQAFSTVPVTRAAVGACTSATDCLSKMTLDEKIGQMTQANKNALTSPSDIGTYFLGSLLSGGGEGPSGAGGTASQWADMYDNFQNYAVATRLGIPLIYGVDAVHGHNNVSGAVIFPHHIGMGATRDTALMQQAEDVTRQEVLGTGMNWAFAPCICVPQNDRWGRTYEGFSEDTALVSALGVASIKGLQGSSMGVNSVLATAKHYMGDGGTTNGTDQGDTQVTEAVLRAIHLPPYQSAVANNVGSIMVSYSSWNGAKMHGNQYLLTTVLKGELGFQGLVITDWHAIEQLPGDYATQVRNSINAGIDMVMVPSDYRTFISTLRTEVNAGRVPMSRIDDAVLRILKQKFALGLFTKYKTDRSYTSQVGSAAHRAVARQAVRESLVLLKNNAVLPLSKTATYKIVVGGSHVDNLGYQMGGWAITWQGGSGATTTGTTFWQALQAAKPANVTLQNVGTNTGSTYSGDIGIAVIGETPYAEGAGDSSTLALSAANVADVTNICSKTTKCIVILMSGRPLIINTQLNQSGAFIAAWLPGTEGLGITDVLFGDSNFTGTLPVTWPNTVSQEPINNGDGKTGLFPFGYGLTYSTTPTLTPTRTLTPGGPTATQTVTRTSTATGLPNANLALNRPATASSTESALYPASAAVDGNATTRWSSLFSDPQWLQVDLGSGQNINRVVLNWEAAYGSAYQIQVSNAATGPWTNIFSTTTGNGAIDDLTGLSGSGRYIRVNGTTRATAYGYSLFEFEVYGSGAAPTATPTRIPTPGGVPVALSRAGWTATGSSTGAGETPANALDSNAATRWSTGAAQVNGQWFRVDMLSARTFNSITLDAGTSSGDYPRGYQVFVSNDGTNWGNAIATGTGTTQLITVPFASQTARYLRIVQTGSSGSWWSIHELNVYN